MVLNALRFWFPSQKFGQAKVPFFFLNNIFLQTGHLSMLNPIAKTPYPISNGRSVYSANAESPKQCSHPEQFLGSKLILA
jgi:hypothetical protein